MTTNREDALAGALTGESGPRDATDALAEDVRERLHTTLTEAGVETPTRPAAAKLTHDQADLLADLLAGFADRGEVLRWEQDLVIHTAGQLRDDWFSRTASNAATVSALIGESWGPTEDMPEELATEIRRGMAAKDVLPAFHAAHETVRDAAVERVDHLADDPDSEAPEPVDVESQKYPLMRPGFAELDGQQESALDDLLAGFETAEDLLAWSLRVISASGAEIERETITEPYFEQELRSCLLGKEPSQEERFVRRSWAAEYLLPAFNRSAAALSQRATEVTAADVAEAVGSGDIS